jgi:quinol monooxygenase YgiN
MIALVVTLKIKDGKQAEFEAMARELVANVRANEPGNAQYMLCKKDGSANEYVFIEQYKSQADLDAHGKTAHFAAAMPTFGACLDGRPDMVRTEVVI